ncbi:MAG: hypothetical protein IKE55_09420 [Kiritimatiellae bacterium]|nr:hypothetical protein [Kiritimatiellia bacterium]
MAVKATNQVDIVDLTDGYSVGLSGYSHSFDGNASGAVASTQSTTVTAKAMCGATQVDCTVANSETTAPTGITTSVTKASGSMSPVITITASTSFTKANAGKVVIPVKVTANGETMTFVQEFAVTVAEKGSPGTSVTVTSIKYATSTSETQPADSAFTHTTVPTVAENNWLWTMVTFSDGNKVYSKSKQGKSGTNGTSYYTHIRYSANSDGSGMVAAPTDSTVYIGVYSGTSATAPTSAGSYTWSRYHGQDGDDAIMLVIESSAGFIFKNTQAATTLTARVFKGGAELNASEIQALGAIKWYKDGGSTAVGTGTTLQITAGTVTNHASYTANLEA